jgi:hypothetical protein
MKVETNLTDHYRKDCSFEWQETWTLPNWLWLKSSQSNNHWTSDRWNSEYIEKPQETQHEDLGK